MRVVFLGTGTSHGVPVIACECAVCTSPDPRNRRARSSVAVETGGRTFLIDTATELRLQALAHGIRRVDAVLYTHYHADHVGGLDDLKAFNAVLGGPLPVFGDAATGADLQRRYAFAFAGTPWIGAIPHLVYHEVHGPFQFGGVEIQPVPLQHGRMSSLGWRIGSFAYATDCNGIPESSRELLQGLDVLVLDALRWRPHPTHFSLPEAIAVVEDLAPRQAFFTHLSHEVDHAATSARLPPGIALAYDGLVVEV